MQNNNPLLRWSFFTILLGLFSWYWANPSFMIFAQNPENIQNKNIVEKTIPESKNQPTELPENKMEPDTQGNASYLAEAGEFRLGDDPAIWIMVFLFFLALAVTLERIYVLYQNRGDNAELVKVLAAELNKEPESINSLEDTISDKKFGLEGRVANQTLKGWYAGEHTMKEYAETSLIAERRMMEKRLVILSTLGNNVPFIGLLGTVLGIMKAFRDLALSSDGGPSVVMKGISEALIATAMGLGVAIPVVIAFNALNKLVQDKLSSAEEISTLMRAIRLSKDERKSNGR